MDEPFLCILTPIFDPALPCLQMLVEALLQQTCQDFIHISLSNGKSPESENYLKSLDSRFIYDERPTEPIKDAIQLVTNLASRRAHGLLTYQAQRYHFFDADLRLLRNDYLQELKENHQKAEIIISKTRYRGNILPIAPFDTVGQIDLANYSFSRRLANNYPYPTNYLAAYPNDFRFFRQFIDFPQLTLNNPYAEKDGNNHNVYLRMSERLCNKHAKDI